MSSLFLSFFWGRDSMIHFFHPSLLSSFLLLSLFLSLCSWSLVDPRGWGMGFRGLSSGSLVESNTWSRLLIYAMWFYFILLLFLMFGFGFIKKSHLCKKALSMIYDTLIHKSCYKAMSTVLSSSPEKVSILQNNHVHDYENFYI